MAIRVETNYASAPRVDTHGDEWSSYNSLQTTKKIMVIALAFFASAASLALFPPYFAIPLSAFFMISSFLYTPGVSEGVVYDPFPVVIVPTHHWYDRSFFYPWRWSVFHPSTWYWNSSPPPLIQPPSMNLHAHRAVERGWCGLGSFFDRSNPSSNFGHAPVGTGESSLRRRPVFSPQNAQRHAHIDSSRGSSPSPTFSFYPPSSANTNPLSNVRLAGGSLHAPVGTRR